MLDLSKAKRGGRPLTDFDIEFLLDRSGSMGSGDSSTGGMSRWDYGQKTMLVLAEACQKIDDDGISVGHFDDSVQVHENTTPAAMQKIFKQVRPGGSTNTAGALQHRFNAYFERRDGKMVTRTEGGFLGMGGKKVTEHVKPAKPAKPTIILVMTDGTPNSQPALCDAICAATQKLNSADELAVVFIQVGDDRSASQFLKQLDSGLKGRTTNPAKYDIVSCFTVDEVRNLTADQLLLKALTENS
jgi:uncharacterized protein YegL